MDSLEIEAPIKMCLASNLSKEADSFSVELTPFSEWLSVVKVTEEPTFKVYLFLLNTGLFILLRTQL